MFFKPVIEETSNKQARCESIVLADTPPLLYECFELLHQCDAQYFACFGGAIRDADYAKRHNKPCNINDYDIRVWFLAHQYDRQLEVFLKKLKNQHAVDEVPSLGNDQIRYCITYKGVELDISVRPAPKEYNSFIPLEAVARERASDSDVGLSSVAIDSLGRAWAMPEYLQDQIEKTITVYPNILPERKEAYLNKMGRKFPDHLIIEFEAPLTQVAETAVL